MDSVEPKRGITIATIVARKWVPGIPRGYGDPKVASEWLKQIADALGAYRGAGKKPDLKKARYEVTLEFRVFPQRGMYRGQNPIHGTDLDNLVKQTLDGLSQTRSKDLPEGLGILTSDNAVYRLLATKELVACDAEMGMWVTIETL